MEVFNNLKWNYPLNDTQELAVKSLLEGKHTFVMAPTGSGKSDIYILPSLLLNEVQTCVNDMIVLTFCNSVVKLVLSCLLL